jgi:inositol oxygenase
MSDQKFSPQETNPLASLDHWEDDLLERYPDPEAIATAKKTEEYRNYDDPVRDTVREFYGMLSSF